jgi:hypothetical protein
MNGIDQHHAHAHILSDTLECFERGLTCLNTEHLNTRSTHLHETVGSTVDVTITRPKR